MTRYHFQVPKDLPSWLDRLTIERVAEEFGISYDEAQQRLIKEETSKGE